MNVFKIEVVKDYLRENMLTIKEFCKLAGIKPYNYRQFMTQDLNITVPNVLKIARAMGVHILDLLCK